MTPTGDSQVAIVGVACRLPGAPDPRAFWELLAAGRHAIGETPAERLPRGAPSTPGPGVRFGAFLEHTDRFDAAFFGVSPREAAAMDPQQRLALELAWEAVESARIAPASIRGEEVGVFLGAIAGDYSNLTYQNGETAVNRHTLAGLHRGIIANRISYTLGLSGPSMTVDAAQSSSLVAVHLACESLLRGEAGMALAGGVHLNLDPGAALGAARFGGLSPDGRCFTFDARANGYVRGEGGGVVVLKPLAAALADGDRIHAVIRGSAVNNDGPSRGLTVPSERAQASVIGAACERAQVDRSQVQYVELHGTGTRVGDPIEAAALGTALGRLRSREDPLPVGSVKTNVGHLEGAAGIVGLIKALLALERRELPASLNFREPNARIPLAELGLSVQDSTGPWPHGDRPLVAGVSSFGVGGTNCHIVLEEAPASRAGRDPDEPDGGGEPAAPDRPLRGPVLLPISAACGAALDQTAERLAAHLRARPELALDDVAHSLARTRTAFERRAVAVGRDRQGLIESLSDLARGMAPPGVALGRADAARSAVFVFPGGGSQWEGMALDLIDASPVFATKLAECERALAPHLDWSVRDVLAGAPGAPPIDRVDVVQPALFAVMVALAELWRSCGVRPAAVLGHSQGEVIAAHVAGGLTLEDAAMLAAVRGRLSGKLVGKGGMASVLLGGDALAELLEPWEGRIEVAADNAPSATLLSGDREALDGLLELCTARGVRARSIPTVIASHSAHVEELRDELLDALSSISPLSGEIPFHSTVTGRPLDTAELDASYWFRNLREKVRFQQTVEALLDEGRRLFVEVSPHPVLGLAIGETIDSRVADPEQATVLGTLRRDEDGPERFAHSLAGAHCAGADLDWDAVLAAGARVDLPTYPFQRERHWIEEAADGGEQWGPDGTVLVVQGALPAPDTALGLAQRGARSLIVAVPQEPAVEDVVELELALAEVGCTVSVVVRELEEWGPADDPVEAEVEEPSAEMTPGDAAVGRPASSLAAAPEQDREAIALALVREEVARILGHPSAAAIEPDRAFDELGFDSVAAVELRERLQSATGLRLPTTVVFNHPTSRRLAERLLAEALGAPGTPPGAVRPQSSDEPIAVVGMACRFPGGVSSPAELWELLGEGRDAIGGFPEDRGWDLERLYDPDPERPDSSYVREGGFLADVAGFDAEFFAIAPREALSMDPQQRLLLESSWEALEDAGIDPRALAARMTGVYVGVSSQDYSAGIGGPEGALAGYRLTGSASSVASGRVAYALGLEGPAISVDTACSSSLVAMHLAAQALRGGECTLALAGGATVLSSPGMFVEFSRQRGLAPDGRSKSFAEAADGVAWSEGVGMLVLERLSDARRNGHEVLALIKGSAVNQDGASNGLTAPNGPSQERVIRQALANARLQPSEVDAVEGHGTGTVLGDPIEAGALLATYGQDRPEPLRLGSIKSNIGHTQAAAGVAGTIKMVEAMRRGVLPATLHVDAPSSKVEWESGELALLTEQQPWEAEGRPRRAGVSSFGISGTNAHVILEQAPEPEPVPPRDPDASPLAGPILLPLSAKSEPALAQAAGRLAERMQESPAPDPLDVACSLALSRPGFEQRAVAVGDDAEQLLGALGALARGEQSEGLLVGRAREGKLALLFSGQGAQRPGMGGELYEADPRFRAALDAVCEELDRRLETPLREVLFATGEEAAARLRDTTWAQPALFAIEVALGRALAERGLRPDLLAGHSVGEIAAAHLGGVFELAEAAELVTARGALMGALPAGGAMAAIEAEEGELAASIEGREAELSIAAVNGPSASVVSGTEEAVEEIRRRWEDDGRKTKRLAVSHAFHSPLMEPMLDRFAALCAELDPKAPQIPIVSNLTGRLLDAEQAQDPAYWVRHAREPVRFAESVETLDSMGVVTYLEAGPEAVLSAMAGEVLGEGSRAAFVPTLREGRSERGAIEIALARAQVAGPGPDWRTFFEGSGAKRVPLPTYPFRRKRYWLEAGRGAADASAVGLTDAEHPLLGAAIEDPAGEGPLLLSGRISLPVHPWLADHAVGGTALLPGTAFLELALRAAEEVGVSGIEELTIEAPMLLPEQGALALRVAVSPPGSEGRREISIHSRPAEEGAEWTRHAGGTLAERPAPAPAPVEAWPPAGAEPVDLEDLYELLAEVGLDYGPAFRGLSAAWRAGEEIFTEARLPEGPDREAGAFALHPALLDAALHGLLAGRPEEQEGATMLPFAWSGVSLSAEGPEELRARFTPRGADAVSIELSDAAGAPLGAIDSLALRPFDAARSSARGAARGGLLELGWQSVELGEAPAEAEVELWRPQISGEGPGAAREAVDCTLAELQRRLAEPAEHPSRLAVLTRGATAAREGESPDPAAAAVWGLVRSAQSEHPGRFALIDEDGSQASEEALGAALALGEAEPQLALREGGALAPRLGHLEGPGPEGEEGPAIDPGRTVLITGATGGLGSLLARHLVERHSARSLLLLSRSGPEAEGAAELAAELERLGAEARILACDAGRREALEEALAEIPAERPLGAVFHCAGALADGTIESLEEAGTARVFAPKVDAAWHLHELTRDADLTAFVCYSSASGTLGGAGQANYAAANVFLDALAERRRTEGLPATSIAWGMWDRESAMTSGLGAVNLARLHRSGIGEISDEHGLELLDAALAAERPAVLALPLRRRALRSLASAGALPPIFAALVKAPRRGPSGSLAASLAALPQAEAEARALELVRSEVAAVLGHAEIAAVEPDRAFQEMGFDSLAAVELRNRLGVAAGLRLGATVVFDHPNAAALARHLLSEASGAAAAAPAVRAGASDEPIAIVGMACRYPGGVSSPAQLWELLSEGRDAIGGFPADRGWDLERLYDPDPEHPGTSYVRHGGFLADAAEFDAEFFAISPREALASDPQQRLLLESSWEALEAAGIDPAALRGEPAGVFAGIMYHDYGSGAAAAAEIEGHAASGVAGSVASGRVAYALGLEGPAISVDTACSSSLVAMHLAAQALRGGECTLALAGGATVLSTPTVFVEFSRQRGLAPDGRSKSFAEAADGVAWSEGVGMLVLERLSDARRNGHEVLALIKGSAVNQDGASNGLTAPNGPSQERVIRQALANARLQPSEVDAVEGHGTGTVLGDPIEAGALLATYGQDRPEPLRLGSIKSNIGHTQAAAGVAGTIKMVEAMRRGVLPATLHVDAPSSKVEWESGELALLTEQQPWEAEGRPRRAGVSSFGISGTNAHVILEQAPEPEPVPPRDPDASPLAGPILLPLSAKSEPALAQAAGRLAERMQESPAPDPLDVACSLALSRPGFEQRAVAVGDDAEQLLGALGALARGEQSEGLLVGRAREGKLALLFSGQGAQRPGMGGELYEADPRFRAALDAVCEELDRRLETPLREVLFATGEEAAARLRDTTWAQPALFAIEVALGRALAERGLRPDLLAGHSVGEIAAAHLGGVFELAEAAELVTARGALMGALPAGGAMAAIEAEEGELAASIEGREAELSIAAVNGPSASVVSGTEEAVEEIRRRWEDDGRKTKRLAVSHAFHSPLMEPMLDRFAALCAELDPKAPQIPIVSNLTGRLLDAEQAQDPAYWVRHAREPVRFAESVETLDSMGVVTYLEAGPEAVLSAMAGEVLGEGSRAAFVPTLREGRSERGAIEIALARAQVAGPGPDWRTFFEGSGAKRVPLPTYPFRRKRYWLEAGRGAADASAVGLTDAEHPLLGAAIEDPAGEGPLLLSGRISLPVHPWLADHAVGGTALLPGTAFLELALRAAEEVGVSGIEELTIEAPMLLPEQGALALRVAVSPPGSEGRREISIHSRPAEEGAEWTRHAGGTLAERPAPAPAPVEAWPPAGAEPVDLEDLYELLAEVGLDYGPAFRGLSAAWRAGEEIFTEARLPEGPDREAGAFALHPALLDAALHGLLAGRPEEQEGATMLPFAWSGVSLSAEGPEELRARFTPRGADAVSIELSDAAGAPLGAIDSLALRPFDAARSSARGAARGGLLELGWQSVELGEAPAEAEVELWRPQISGEGPGAAREAVDCTLAELQRRLAEPAEHPSRLAVLTRGATAAREGESPDPAAAAVWGLVRSAQSEHPGRFALIDEDGSQASEEALGAALALGEAEPQLALREGEALAARAMPLHGAEDSLVLPPGPWRLEAPERGSIEGLALVPDPLAAAPLGPTQVRIEMRAAGLNFREVLAVLGYRVPGGERLGAEGAGVVSEVGSQVEDLAPGDAVFGLIPSAFAPRAVAERRRLLALPEGWSFEQGASVPVVFATAYVGLCELAGLKRGERVLIHAGAGGVGMAAIQLARHLGAEVFATAGPSKWDALREAGLAEDHIASSRDLEFRDKFLAASGGEGVDVVLNSLAGEFVDASLELLPRGGRFLEMGRTDLRDAERVAREHPGVSYGAFDIVELDDERNAEVLSELLALFDRGALRPLPHAAWDLRQAPAAFRFLREGRNVGKLVLTVPRAIDPGRTVLITGATGGLGSLLARHLVERHSARSLLLLSRSGPEAEGAAELAAELERLGAEARILACDAGRREALEEALAEIPAERPLGAVFHCAGALADGTIESLEEAGTARVFAPKVDAAWHLHELTRDADLTAFVCYSSASGTLGGAGQANYAAANVFLDALAERRRTEGLPATSIAWGMWDRESAMTSGLGAVNLARLHRSGIGEISDEHGLELLDAALAAERPAVLALPLRRRALRSLASAGALPPIFAALVKAPRRGPSGSLAASLAALPQAEAEARALELVRSEVAAVLGHAEIAAVEPDRAFQEMGFDSLAAVELRNRLGTAAGLRLGSTVVFDHPNAAALARHLLSEVGGAVRTRREDEVRALLAQLEAALAALEGDDETRERTGARLRALLATLSGADSSGAENAHEDLTSMSDEEMFELIDEEFGSR